VRRVVQVHARRRVQHDRVERGVAVRRRAHVPLARRRIPRPLHLLVRAGRVGALALLQVHEVRPVPHDCRDRAATVVLVLRDHVVCAPVVHPAARHVECERGEHRVGEGAALVVRRVVQVHARRRVQHDRVERGVAVRRRAHVPLARRRIPRPLHLLVRAGRVGALALLQVHEVRPVSDYDGH